MRIAILIETDDGARRDLVDGELPVPAYWRLLIWATATLAAFAASASCVWLVARLVADAAALIDPAS